MGPSRSLSLGRRTSRTGPARAGRGVGRGPAGAAGAGTCQLCARIPPRFPAEHSVDDQNLQVRRGSWCPRAEALLPVASVARQPASRTLTRELPGTVRDSCAPPSLPHVLPCSIHEVFLASYLSGVTRWLPVLRQPPQTKLSLPCGLPNCSLECEISHPSAQFGPSRPTALSTTGHKHVPCAPGKGGQTEVFTVSIITTYLW